MRDGSPSPHNSVERRLADVLQSTASRWWECTSDGLRRLRLNAAGGQPLRLCSEDPAGAPDSRVAPIDSTRVAVFFATLAKAKLPALLEFRAGADGASRWTRLTVVRRDGRGRALRFSGVLSDISPLEQLKADILQINERVQNRIGQELHDDLCQVLAGLSCLTRVLENRIAPQLPQEVDNLREINHQLVDAMDRTRALTHGLYPARMRSGDARAALLELAKEVEVRFGVKVRTAFRGRFPAHVAQEILQVYRIAQEAISNAIRHGRAKSIDLALESRRDSMQLRVRDNGTGFSKADATQPGIGLQIMQHRAAQIGGKIHVGNAPRRGALVVLHYHPVARL
jgi:signal transduction histidine kinase